MTLSVKQVIVLLILSFCLGVIGTTLFLSPSDEHELDMAGQHLENADSVVQSMQNQISHLEQSIQHYQREIDLFDSYLAASKNRFSNQATSFYRKRDSLRTLIKELESGQP